MDFWLMDVHSTVVVNGKDVAFDYINTFYEESDAIKEAKPNTDTTRQKHLKTFLLTFNL